MYVHFVSNERHDYCILVIVSELKSTHCVLNKGFLHSFFFWGGGVASHIYDAKHSCCPAQSQETGKNNSNSNNKLEVKKLKCFQVDNNVMNSQENQTRNG